MYITVESTTAVHLYVPDKTAKATHPNDPEGGTAIDELFWDRLSKEQENKIKELLWEDFRNSANYYGELDEDERFLNKEHII